MLKRIFSRKAQNMAEYAIIFGVVIAAAVGISTIIKEGIQDRVVREVRKIGDTDNAALTANFDLISNEISDRDIDAQRTVTKGGGLVETEDMFVNTTTNQTYNAGN